MSAEFQTADKLLKPGTIAAAPAVASLAIPADVQLAVEASEGTVTAAQVRVLQNTICKKFSIEQLQLYLTICHRKGVDPFTEAYGFPNSDGGLAFGLRIDGMRALAMRTGQYKSRIVTSLWVSEDGTPISMPEGSSLAAVPKGAKLVGAACSIEREGMAEPIREEAWMNEYDKGSDPRAFGWKQFPETMIRKVAESKALRAAFPDALSGVYEPAELPPA